MARRRALKNIKAPGPKKFRVGPKRPKGWKRPVPPPQGIVLPNGTKMNAEEAVVYRALIRRKVQFEPQAKIGGGSVKGGGIVDFALWQHGIAIEYQGPFHATSGGVAKDFLRRVARQEAGLQTVYIYKQDLQNIDQVLGKILAAPMVAASMRGH